MDRQIAKKIQKFKIISTHALLHFQCLNKLFIQIHIFLLTLWICMLEGPSSLDEKKKKLLRYQENIDEQSNLLTHSAIFFLRL